MLFKILKKDLKRRKAVNFILLLFITLATVFLASSINNILVVSSAVDYFMDYAKVPDVNMITSNESEKEQIDTFLQNTDYVKDYEYNRFINLGEKSIQIIKDGKKSKLDGNGADIYAAKQDVDYCKVFNQKGKEFSVKEGEVGVSASVMERNGLKPGDKLEVTLGEYKKEFTIRLSMKDAAFGSDMVGLSRLIVNERDFEELDGKSTAMCLYYITSDKEDKLTKAVSDEGYTSLVNMIKKSTYQMTYSFDMIIAALLILIGICLILIALLVLRFTLVFTLEEDYQEIGIMKALGFRESFIKKIYLVKYLAIVVCGALLGLVCSLPVSSVMISGVSTNMVMESSEANIFVNLLSTLFIIFLVLLFCYLCTQKLSKVSAITAIRGGQTGERFSKGRGIRLYKRSRMPVSSYLGVNDIASNLKRYLVLVITFCISFILITLPLNTLNTMESKEMVRRFYLDPESAVYVGRIEAPGESSYKTKHEVKKGVNRLSGELKEKGYDAELTGTLIYFSKFSEERGENGESIMVTQVMGNNTGFGDYQKGSAPKLENEIAFSKQIMEANEWEIGDSVYSTVGGKEEKFVITGIYSDYMQLGKSARFSDNRDFGDVNIFDYWSIMVYMQTEETQEQLAEKLNEELPAYEWKTAQDMVDQNVGGIRAALQEMVVPMTAMLCAVIMLITMLMEKLFIVREKGEIAVMKSVGFRNRSIRAWQIVRMVCVVAAALVISVPLSLLSNQFLLRPIFASMGAEVNIQIVPWQVYGIFPAVLLAAILLATIFASGGIKKIDIREINNLE